MRAWLRPARKVASRRLLELQHDQGLSARAELWGRYQVSHSSSKNYILLFSRLFAYVYKCIHAHTQAMVVAALPFAPRPAPARIKRHNRALHHRKPQQPLTPSSAHLPVSEEGEWFDAGFERQGGKSNSGKYTGLLPSDETAAPAAAGEIKAIPTTDTSQEQQREESPKPLLPSVVKAHVQAARLSSSSQSGLVASPPTATVHQAARLPSCQRAMVPIKSPPNQPPPPPQRVYHEYLRLKRTWYLKEAEGEGAYGEVSGVA